MSVSIIKRRRNSRKLHLVIFGSADRTRTKFRLEKQAIHTGWFETVNCFSDRDLFLQRYNKSMLGRIAGYGWWKPAIILQLLNNIPDNDIVLYLDSGHNIIKECEKKLITYLEYVLEHNILAFFLGDGTNNIDEKQYTKRDLLIHLNCDNERFYSNQFASGQLLVVNNDIGKSFIHSFLNVFNDIHLANDEPSKVKEHPEFIAHRHDQSILSLLYKLTGLGGLKDESDTWLEANGPIGPFSADRIADPDLDFLNWPDDTYTVEQIRKLVYKKRVERQKDNRYRLN